WPLAAESGVEELLSCLSRSVKRGRRTAERREQCALVRCIFGNPFRASPAVEPWGGGGVRKLAQAADDKREMPGGMLDNARLAVLSDAMAEAGCDDESLLEHLRHEGPHSRGCHVVDCLLHKQ